MGLMIFEYYNTFENENLWSNENKYTLEYSVFKHDAVPGIRILLLCKFNSNPIFLGK